MGIRIPNERKKILSICNKIIANNSAKVLEYNNGQAALISLLNQAMVVLKGGANPREVKDILEERMNMIAVQSLRNE